MEGRRRRRGEGGQAGGDCQGSSRRPPWASALAGPGELASGEPGFLRERLPPRVGGLEPLGGEGSETAKQD